MAMKKQQPEEEIKKKTPRQAPGSAAPEKLPQTDNSPITRPVVQLDPQRLKRSRPPRNEDDDLNPPQPSVSAGPIDRVIELAFNPTREKIREVTIIDRLQGRLFPIMDSTNALFRNCMEIALYRQSKDRYRSQHHKIEPDELDPIDELMFRTAQWQKSVGGKNLEKATDLALAETETQSEESTDVAGADAWKD